MVLITSIMRTFLPRIHEERTYKELKERTKSTSNNGLQKKLKELIEEGIIRREKKDSIYLYYLTNKRIIYPLIELTARKYLEEKHIERDIHITIKAIEEQTTFFSLILFGSYAKGKETKESDIDIAVITEKKIKEETIIKREIELYCMHTIDIHFITKKEFEEMIKNKEENLGKQIANENLPIRNAESFYYILYSAKAYAKYSTTP